MRPGGFQGAHASALHRVVRVWVPCAAPRCRAGARWAVADPAAHHLAGPAHRVGGEEPVPAVPARGGFPPPCGGAEPEDHPRRRTAVHCQDGRLRRCANRKLPERFDFISKEFDPHRIFCCGWKDVEDTTPVRKGTNVNNRVFSNVSCSQEIFDDLFQLVFGSHGKLGQVCKAFPEPG